MERRVFAITAKKGDALTHTHMLTTVICFVQTKVSFESEGWNTKGKFRNWWEWEYPSFATHRTLFEMGSKEGRRDPWACLPFIFCKLNTFILLKDQLLRNRLHSITLVTFVCMSVYDCVYTTRGPYWNGRSMLQAAVYSEARKLGWKGAEKEGSCCEKTSNPSLLHMIRQYFLYLIDTPFPFSLSSSPLSPPWKRILFGQQLIRVITKVRPTWVTFTAEYI